MNVKKIFYAQMIYSFLIGEKTFSKLNVMYNRNTKDAN